MASSDRLPTSDNGEVMQHALIETLVASPNEAADDVLLEALRVGSLPERATALNALLRRRTVHGLQGVIGLFDSLPEPLQRQVLASIGVFHSALRESGRSDDPSQRLASMKLIALGRQGKLCYVLSENLHDLDERLSKAAAEALVELSSWVHAETRRLNDGEREEGDTDDQVVARYRLLIEHRGEIESAVARAMDLHRGRHGGELLKASLLLCDSPASKTLGILASVRHGGQGMMVRKLQQTPEPDHVEAFLQGAAHGQLRTQFGTAFSHIESHATLSALLRRTHWLRDHQLQLCMKQAQHGCWLEETSLRRDVERRSPVQAPDIAAWIVASGLHDSLQDQRLEDLRQLCGGGFEQRLRLLRTACTRDRSASTQFLRVFLNDPDERIVRMAAREIARRRPADCESVLLARMSSAPDSVRRVISRAVGESGFDQFWQRFDRMDRETRQQAGRAMLKLLPDASARLRRKLAVGSMEEQIRALQVVQELGLVASFRDEIEMLCSHGSPRLRSKAVAVLADAPTVASDVLLERVLSDGDARVRANAIEVVEAREDEQFLPLLTQRARAGHNRERANAIKALCRMRVSTASSQLLNMLRDERHEHRISALWALRQIGWWQLVREVALLARDDQNLRVRRYAMGVLRVAMDALRQEKPARGA
jgi:HEAT repeat protein